MASVFGRMLQNKRKDTIMHKTRRKLLDTAMELILRDGIDAVTADMVLQQSRISKGSLYYHFDDFPDLVESALVEMFKESVDKNRAVLRQIVYESADKKECLEGLMAVTRQTQTRELFAVRAGRAAIMGMSLRNPRLASKVATVQTELTRAYAELFKILQDRGWMSRDFDPQAAAILIQAYTLGKIVDDVSSEPIAPEKWAELIDAIMFKIFGISLDD